MKGILQEIKSQPPHIRELFMWVCVVITFSVIGFAWFRTTTREFVALLNPEEATVTQGLAAGGKPTGQPSPFATIYTAGKDLFANIGELFNFSGRNNFEIKNTNVTTTPTPTIKPQPLPVSH